MTSLATWECSSAFKRWSRWRPGASASTSSGTATPSPTSSGITSTGRNGMRTSKQGIEFIKRHEGLRLTAYDDGGGVFTIGYGSTRGVRKGMVITEGQAEARLI